MKFDLTNEYDFMLDLYPWSMSDEDIRKFGYPLHIKLGKMKWSEARQLKKSWMSIIDPAKCGVDLVRVTQKRLKYVDSDYSNNNTSAPRSSND